MQTRIQEMPLPAVAGGLLVVGAALWQLGIEFERAWMRSYDGPLIGETIAEDHGRVAHGTQRDPSVPPIGNQRRWVANHHPRSVAPAAHAAGSD
ncbi:MAG TPA: hypothetical protein VN892_08825 [Solirubrobacteraceae bacterium]|nr:hypothetical protein [Solirubrobacteraceae bacterium]